MFFLMGTFTTSVDPNGVVLASATRRHCTAPAGTTLFFPIINNECSSVEPPPFGPFTDRKGLTACNHQFLELRPLLARLVQPDRVSRAEHL